jgi:hypothetical protein
MKGSIMGLLLALGAVWLVINMVIANERNLSTNQKVAVFLTSLVFCLPGTVMALLLNAGNKSTDIKGVTIETTGLYETPKTYDLNLPVQFCDFDININNLTIRLFISGGSTINSIDFTIELYNSFGDKVGEVKEIIQSLNLPDTNSVLSHKVLLDRDDVKNVKVLVNRILRNGAVITIDEHNFVTINPTYLTREDRELLQTSFTVVPYEDKDYWLCGCETVNTGSKCTNCERNKDKIFELLSPDNLKTKLEAGKKTADENKEAEKQKQAQKK